MKTDYGNRWWPRVPGEMSETKRLTWRDLVYDLRFVIRRSPSEYLVILEPDPDNIDPTDPVDLASFAKHLISLGCDLGMKNRRIVKMEVDVGRCRAEGYYANVQRGK